ncbi:MAG: hypothetical protein OXI08_08130, partial [Cyanobacteria bacterium MAG IRC4_bin_6]|nr:hypothetical protein [Cyanobacteria bacterium MAG IRC4_bin_6]
EDRLNTASSMLAEPIDLLLQGLIQERTGASESRGRPMPMCLYLYSNFFFKPHLPILRGSLKHWIYEDNYEEIVNSCI